MNIKVLAIAALLIIASAFGYMYQSGKANTENVKQQNIAYEQQQQQAKQDAIDAEKAREQQQVEMAKTKELKQEQNKLNNEKEVKDQALREQTQALEDIKVIEEKARKNLFDPDAAKFKNIKGNCGEINAKNKMGGYTGYRRFIYDPQFDTVSIEEESDGLYNSKMMDILWGKKCP